MNAYYFREDETTVLGAIKAQLPFSEGKYSCLIREIKFRSLQFSIIWIFSYYIRTDQIALARTNIPVKDHETT